MNKKNVIAMLILLFWTSVANAKTTTHRNYIGGDCYVTEITIYEHSGNSSTSTQKCSEYDEIKATVLKEREKEKKLKESKEEREKNNKKEQFEKKLKDMTLQKYFNEFTFDNAIKKPEVASLAASEIVKKIKTIQQMRDFLSEAYIAGYREKSVMKIYRAMNKMVNMGYGSAVMKSWKGRPFNCAGGVYGLFNVKGHHDGKSISFVVTPIVHDNLFFEKNIENYESIIDSRCR